MVKLENWSVIQISGNDVTNFLQGQLTCDMAQITEQQSSLAALCNHQGRVLAIFLLFKKNNEFYALLPSVIKEQFTQHLAKFAVFSKTTLVDVTESMLVVAFIGDQIEILLESYYSNLPTNSYETISENDFTICQLPLNTSCYIGFGPRDQEEYLNKTTPLINDDSLWQVACILSGFPILQAQTIGIATPHMLNLQNLNAISFNKGCYVGQEIIARTHYLGKAKRQLCLLSFEETFSAKPGDVISSQGQEVGTIINDVSLKASHYALAIIQDSALDQELNCQEHRVIDLIKACDLDKITA